eukprot:TRINITY_DN1007_c0_g2_i1.p1 TRINITY_DN1007_c0_g2~~TRINITY_DN1007_c0_g2_i1.p1  ORF type:complete len:868 (+),score=257.09 TRINITY_DN1007_c0_g2_i1:44-2605(+)
MGKSRKAAPRSADKSKVHKDRNPFESRKLKSRRNVLNSSVKGTIVDTGRARAKAEEKRDRTLGVALNERNHDSRIVDRRFSKDQLKTLNSEEKGLILFQRARQKAYLRKDGAGDDELEEMESLPLTHGGRPLSLPDHHAGLDEFSESDSDEEDSEFGGFEVTSRSTTTDDPEATSSGKKTKEEVMMEVMAKSKAYKHEARVAKNAQMDKTDSLDAGFGDLMSLLGVSAQKSTVKKLLKTADKAEDEDSEEEAERNKKEKKERMRRGRAPAEVPSAAAAAELDEFDRLALQLEQDTRATPTNALLTPEAIAKAESERLRQLEAARIRRMKDPEDISDDETNLGRKLTPKEKRAKEKAQRKREKESQQGGDDLMDTYAVAAPSLSDDESDSSEEESEEGHIDESEDSDESPQSVKSSTTPDLSTSEPLPFTYEMPASYEALASLLEGQSEARQNVILTRLRACFHLSLSPKNRSKLTLLYSLLLRHLLRLAKSAPLPHTQLRVIVDHLFAMTKEIPQSAATLARHYCKHMADAFNKKQRFPSPSRLYLIAVLTQLWPVSDRRHVVVTPLLLFISKVLRSTVIDTALSARRGLFLSSLFMRAQVPGERFATEPLMVLERVLRSFVPSTRKPHEDPSDSLTLSLKDSPKKVKLRPLSFDALHDDDDVKDSYESRANLLNTTCLSLSKYVSTCDFAKPTLAPLVKRVSFLVKQILKLHAPLPSSLTKILEKTRTTLKESLTIARAHYTPLTLHTPRHVHLKELEPDYQTVYTGSKLSGLDREARIAKHLKNELRQNRKGAERELRLDARYLSRKQQQRQRDATEKQQSVVKRVHSMLEQEQHGKKQEEKLKRARRSAF